jgi:hypothetical protein
MTRAADELRQARRALDLWTLHAAQGLHGDATAAGLRDCWRLVCFRIARDLIAAGL